MLKKTIVASCLLVGSIAMLLLTLPFDLKQVGSLILASTAICLFVMAIISWKKEENATKEKAFRQQENRFTEITNSNAKLCQLLESKSNTLLAEINDSRKSFLNLLSKNQDMHNTTSSQLANAINKINDEVTTILSIQNTDQIKITQTLNNITASINELQTQQNKTAEDTNILHDQLTSQVDLVHKNINVEIKVLKEQQFQSHAEITSTASSIYNQTQLTEKSLSGLQKHLEQDTNRRDKKIHEINTSITAIANSQEQDQINNNTNFDRLEALLNTATVIQEAIQLDFLRQSQDSIEKLTTISKGVTSISDRPITQGQVTKFFEANKLQKVVDRSTETEILFSYDDTNQTVTSDTYIQGALRYQNITSLLGAPIKGCEFDNKGKIKSEFSYNTLGQLKKKTIH